MPTDLTVSDLARGVVRGTYVLPDFQRSFVWKPDDVRDLLISVLGDYHIGSMLFMDTITADSPFAIRLVEGVEKIDAKAKPQNLIRIILDGQQRTSSLVYALYGPAIPLSGRKSPYLFFLDLRYALKDEWENAVVAANVGNKRQLSQANANPDYISFKEFTDVGALSKKLTGSKYVEHLADVMNIVNNFSNYRIHEVSLGKDVSLNRVVETFERINRTGEPLSVTDLLVARVYQKEIRLRALIEQAHDRFKFLKDEQGLDPEYVLRVMCLARGKEVRRKDILELSADSFGEDWEAACGVLEEGYKRIINRKNGYGAITFKRWTPSSSMIVPLSALLLFIKARKLDLASSFVRIDDWYWASVFGNRYNEAVNTTTYSDYTKMTEWLLDERKVPPFIADFKVEDVDLNVSSQSSAVYRGVMCLVSLKGAFDFRSGNDPSDDVGRLEDDHIFPKSLYRENGVLNRSLILSNEKKGAQVPAEYFSALEKINGESEFGDILATHLIDANGLKALKENRLDDFVKARDAAIRSEIAEHIRANRAPR